MNINKQSTKTIVRHIKEEKVIFGDLWLTHKENRHIQRAYIDIQLYIYNWAVPKGEMIPLHSLNQLHIHKSLQKEVFLMDKNTIKTCKNLTEEYQLELVKNDNLMWIIYLRKFKNKKVYELHKALWEL